MAGRPKLLLLDAGAVFAALEHGAWDAMTRAYDIIVPKIVLDEVQFYYPRGETTKVYVDTAAWREEGLIRIYEAPVEDLADTLTLINTPDAPEIHDGEAEALTYLRLEVAADATHIAFVSADGAAIQATALLDRSHTSRSLREVLDGIGYSKPLAVRYQRDFVERHLKKGFERSLRRSG